MEKRGVQRPTKKRETENHHAVGLYSREKKDIAGRKKDLTGATREGLRCMERRRKP